MAITKKQALLLRKGDYVKVRINYPDWTVWVPATFIQAVAAYGIKSKRKQTFIQVMHHVDLYQVFEGSPLEAYDYPSWFNLKDVKLITKKNKGEK
ncbi:MAG: hypothetical protein ACOX3C_05760 [Bacilli bacterium]|jgi:hypothetical protein